MMCCTIVSLELRLVFQSALLSFVADDLGLETILGTKIVRVIGSLVTVERKVKVSSGKPAESNNLAAITTHTMAEKISTAGSDVITQPD